MFSVCTTNYNCAQVLQEHLRSVYENLSGLEYEYVVVDNASKDGGFEILRKWKDSHPNMTVLRQRCTMGEGRQIAFQHSRGTHIVVIDTDVVYSPLLRGFLDRYFEKYPGLSVQAIFCGIFPREQWVDIGGRRSLNTNEDLDMWVRLGTRDWIRWYPVAVGTNVKDPEAVGSFDHLSTRYPRHERVFRLFRREWDLWKTRGLKAIDVGEMIRKRSVDLRLDSQIKEWPQNRVHQSTAGQVLEFVRQMKKTLNQP